MREDKRERNRKRESEICFISLIKRVVGLCLTEIPEKEKEKTYRERRRERERGRE